ncbi:MAG: hypothetical protein JXR70_04960 [Spirochaetales bacterium]|nr:hypothetical protein [Spirochaetales bacterium]
MKVEFMIDFLDEKYNLIELKENELASNMDRLRNFLEKQDELEGSLVLIKSGQTPALIHDAMWFSAINLCFKFVINSLIEPLDCLKHNYFVQSNYIVITRSEQFIQILGDDEDFPAVTYPEKELLPALYQCGCRIITFLETLKCHDYNVPEMKELAEKARALLKEKQFLV